MERKNLIQRFAMPLPELERYHREQRKERFENNEPFGGVRLRKALHPVLVCGMKLLHLLGRQKVTILGDRRSPTDRPLIFAATHIGWDDVEMILSSIGDHAYLFWGDPRESYRTMDGFLLGINGTIICDTDSKPDRFIGKETCVKWLSQGGNLLIFPEGAWNAAQSLPVMPLYTGAAEMAIRTGAELVPVAIEQYGKDYTINIGRNISASGCPLEQKQRLTEELRDAMAALKWEIWETQPQARRDEIPADFGLKWLQKLQSQMEETYTLEDIEITRFHTKAEIARKEVEDCLDRLVPCRENAFLFRKR